MGAAEQSHSFQLMLKLLDLGLIPLGRFSWVHVWHDSHCAAVGSGGLEVNCRCNPEAEIGGQRYLFSDFVEPWAVQ
jgi:hypothetical protein